MQLREYVTLTCRSIDQISLQAYVPKLQSVGWSAASCAGSRLPDPSSAAFGKIGAAYVAQVPLRRGHLHPDALLCQG